MSTPTATVETVTLDGEEITLETGEIARQASGSVVVRHRDSFLLATVVADEGPRPGADFFPLTVEYRERMSAAGRIPGNYFRREGRITEAEILTSRLIDRTLRPLFPKGFRNETQVQVMVFGADPESDLEALALLGAAAALQVSDVPFQGPVTGLRVVRYQGRWRALASPSVRALSHTDLITSYTRDGLAMVEGESLGLPDEELLEALDYAEAAATPLLDALDRLRDRAGKPQRPWTPPEPAPLVDAAVEAFSAKAVDAALSIDDKHARRRALGEARALVVEAAERGELADDATAEDAQAAFDRMVHHRMRRRLLDGHRIGGRALDEVRPLTIRVGPIAAAHGSALFTRGETQALVTATLGGDRDAQDRETLRGKERDTFLLHYNFPSYSVGETRPMRGPGRREIGHGNLARRALDAVLPAQDQFPYTIRVVSDVTESNGSSSMATVCGGTLALMDAGVPLEAPVAGVAMGLIREGDEIAILTDILGDEDHLGDMDFKVAGTADRVTAVQLDNKIGSLPRDVLVRAIRQAKAARRFILAAMAEALASPRKSISARAPQILRIDPSKIGVVIGKGGATIQKLEADTGARVEVKNDGRVIITGPSAEAVNAAIRRVEALTKDLERGAVYEASVVSIKDFGVFVRFGDHEGLVHVSELADHRVSHPSDELSVGDAVRVKVLGTDDRGRLKLSRRAAAGTPEAEVLSL